MESSKKKVMLYGGSYNPIHQGHINAALTSSMQINADEVWLMPRKYNYDGSLLLDGKYRIQMIEMAIENLSHFKICKMELQDKKKELIYTYNTAVRLTKKYKDIDFYFLIGADQLNNLRHWYNAKELTKLFHFVCYQRPGYKIDKSIAEEYQIQIIDGPLVDISSTTIRSGIFQKIDEDIQNYIMEKQLYLKERVMPRLSEELFIHVLSTARLAKKIALANNVNSNRAYVAGILHDIAKGLTFLEIETIVKKHYPDKLSYPKYFYHAYASAYIAIHDFGIRDEKILKAIRNHSRATKNMSKLDKIIYCADILEENRPFANTLNEVRKEAFENIDSCFVQVMKEQLQFLKKSNASIDPSLENNITYYERKLNNGR